MEAPKAYPQQEPAKAQNILTLDCRGLEFVDFKADVGLVLLNRKIYDRGMLIQFLGRLQGHWH